jgi:Ribonuclease G/E
VALQPFVETIFPPAAGEAVYRTDAPRANVAAERSGQNVREIAVAVEHVWRNLREDFANQAPLCAQRAWRRADGYRGNLRVAQLRDQRRLSDAGLQQSDEADIVAFVFLANRQRIDDSLQSAERRRCDEM